MATYLKHQLNDRTGRVQLHVAREKTRNVRLFYRITCGAQIVPCNLQRQLPEANSVQPRQTQPVARRPRPAGDRHGVHSPVNGQRVSRRRRGDEIAQQVSARRKRDSFHEFSSLQFDNKTPKDIRQDLAFVQLGAITNALYRSRFFIDCAA